MGGSHVEGSSNCDFRSVGALSSQQRGSGKQTAFAVRLIQWRTSEHHILAPALECSDVRLVGQETRRRVVNIARRAASNCTPTLG
jgi:hypothetical protein